MRIRPLLLAVAGALVAAEAVAVSVALLPVRRGVREGEATAWVERAIASELASRAGVVDAERVRAELRRLRLRSVDGARAEQLAALAAEVGADWLVAAEVHDALEAGVPDVALSARLYDGRDGRVAWVGSIGRSGLDGRRLLGLGEIDSLVELVPVAVAELLRPILPEDAQALRPPPVPAAPPGGVAAIVPFTAVAAEEGLEVAIAATETLRAVLAAAGVELAHPGCVRAALRGPEGVRWGELDAATRNALQERCGAAYLITGAVERWERAGSGRAPEPTIAVALRRLDAASGEIVWAGSLEAGGFDREGWFGRGRVHSRGGQLRRLLERMSNRMLAADPAVKVMKESS